MHYGAQLLTFRSFVSFIGFLPAEDPELLCLVVVENPRKGKWGGRIAAPAFRRVVERILYLPEGRKVAPPPRTRSGEVARVAIPDLRGMTRRVARFQAGLRELPVTFSGKGDVVVWQAPLRRTEDGDLFQISCVLGNAGDPEADVRGIPLRQARLLQALPGDPALSPKL